MQAAAQVNMSRQEAQAASQAYKHPVVKPGDHIEFWLTAQRGEIKTKHGLPGIIEAITGPRTVKVVLLGGGRLQQRFDSVRFIDDPWVPHNDDVLSGIWDFSGQTKKLQEMEKRMIALEKKAGLLKEEKKEEAKV